MQSRIPTYIFSLFIPLALVIGCFGFYNRVEPRILGFPFIYAWIFACFFLVLATSLCIGQSVPAVCGVVLVNVLQRALYPKATKAS